MRDKTCYPIYIAEIKMGVYKEQRRNIQILRTKKCKEREGTKSMSGRLNESKNKYIGNNVDRKMGNE